MRRTTFMGMEGSNPYEPPRSGQTKSRRIGPVFWLVLWFVFAIVFCAVFMGGDPFTSALIMGFGLVSFFLGNRFAKAGEGVTGE
jgi:hypothetical protein